MPIEWPSIKSRSKPSINAAEQQSDSMITHANQLLELDDQTFIEAVFECCCRRTPDSEESSFYLGELRSGRGKVAIIAELVQLQGNQEIGRAHV